MVETDRRVALVIGKRRSVGGAGAVRIDNVQADIGIFQAFIDLVFEQSFVLIASAGLLHIVLKDCADALDEPDPHGNSRENVGFHGDLLRGRYVRPGFGLAVFMICLDPEGVFAGIERRIRVCAHLLAALLYRGDGAVLGAPGLLRVNAVAVGIRGL